MSRRVRLTARTTKAAEDKTPYPGDVNQNRTDPSMGQYDTFVQTVNHELPDMRTEWKGDSRDEIGFGVPNETAIRTAASKAVKLAVHILGEKVDPKLIEAQATDLMALGSKALTASLMRIADTEPLYAADEVMPPAPEDKKEEVKASVAVKAEEKKEPCACKAASVAVKAEEAPKVEEKKPEDKPAVPVAASVVKAEDTMPEDKKDEVVAGDDSMADDLAGGDDDSVEASEMTVATDGEGLDINLNEDDSADVTAGEDAPEGLWEDKTSMKAEDECADAEEDKPVVASAKKPVVAKKGAKTIGGQPKLASVKVAGENDLSSLWKTAPGLEIFE